MGDADECSVLYIIKYAVALQGELLKGLLHGYPEPICIHKMIFLSL